MGETYRTLEPQKIIKTLERLERRITERFPRSGLSRVCGELLAIATHAGARVAALERPRLDLRLLAAALLLGGIAFLAYLFRLIDIRSETDSVYGVLQGVDAGFNIIVLIGAAALFLWRMETLAKRRKALKDLHELRSIIHVIDMHQLTKDPGSAMISGPRTLSSPERTMTPFQLTRYLDYCSEMLSISAKVAALYAQSSQDELVVSTVNDLEQLTANLSEKIWQKIAIMRDEHRSKAPVPGSEPEAASGDGGAMVDPVAAPG